MAAIDIKNKEIHIRIGYFGVSRSGKFTSLRNINDHYSNTIKGGIFSYPLKECRILFSKYRSSDDIFRNYTLTWHIYTISGPVLYISDWDQIIQLSDHTVFVADSQVAKLEENINSLHYFTNRISEINNNINYPMIIQYNKRDLPNALNIDTLNRALNTRRNNYVESVAIKGIGVIESLNIARNNFLSFLQNAH